MKKTPCRNPICGNRRVHHDLQNQVRGTVLVEVDDNFPETEAVFCSYTCALLDEWTSLRYETDEQIAERQEKWRKKHAERSK